MNSVYDTPASNVTQSVGTHNPPLFSAKGRIGRLRYLAHSSWITLLLVIAAIFVSMALGLDEVGDQDMVLGVVSLVALVIQLIFAIKRVHDMNWPGIAAAIAVVPLLNILLILWPGTKGPNKYGPPPGPNTALIILGGLILPFVFIIGILAAIAVPAYNDYTGRAQVGEAFAMTSGAKTAIASYYQYNSAWPDASALAELDLEEAIQGNYAIATVQPDTGVIDITMLDHDTMAAGVAGGRLVFRPVVTRSEFKFECTSPDISGKYLPQSCEGQ